MNAIQNFFNIQAPAVYRPTPWMQVQPTHSVSYPIGQVYANSWDASVWGGAAHLMQQFFGQVQVSAIGSAPEVTPAAAEMIRALPDRVQEVSPEGVPLSWFGNTVMLSNDGVAPAYGQNPYHYASSETARQILEATRAAAPGSPIHLVDVSESYGGPYRPSNPQYALKVGGDDSAVGTTYNVGLIAKEVSRMGVESAYRMLSTEMQRDGVSLSMEQFKSMFQA